MRYTIALLACCLLLVQCRPDIDVQPTGSYDTLGVQWMTVETPNVIYFFQGTGVDAASIYVDMHEQAYTQLNGVFNARLPRKLRYFVWTDLKLAEQLLQLDVWRGFAVFRECECHVRFDMSLGHEMVHILSYWMGGIPRNAYSKFISEGVAVAFDLNKDDKIGRARKALEGHNVKSILEIWQNSLTAPEELVYPVGGAFVAFLYKKNQPDKFFALIRNQRVEDAQAIYGVEELNALIREFDAQVGL